MKRYTQITTTASIVVLLVSASSALNQQTQTAQGKDSLRKDSSVSVELRSPKSEPVAGRPTYLKAFVIDDRLSALRREPALQSQVIRRLRLGRLVFIVGTSKPRTGQPRFCRVAVTRRTRGWLHQSALAVPSRSGEDQRIINLIESSSDAVDRITLCRIVIERFGHSRLLPHAMLLLGEEAERVADTLSKRTQRRLADVRGTDASLRDYYLSDAGLDRYSRLGIAFDFNDAADEFIYNGKAYREIVRRFPKSEEAGLARQRLGLTDQKTARQR